MERWRHLIERRPALAAWLLLAALALRLLAPPGFMPAASAHGMALVACPEWSDVAVVRSPHAGHHPTDRDSHTHAETSCAFAGLGQPTLAAGDPLPLALPIRSRWIVAALPRRVFRVVPAAHTRPPPHAPPALA